MAENPPAKILIVDDEAAQMKALCDTLKDYEYETTGFVSAREALKTMEETKFDLLLTDLMMPEIDGISLLQAAGKKDPNLVAIIMTGEGTITTAVEAMKFGALDYILKPFKLKAILPVLGRALAVRRLRLENAALERRERERTEELTITNRELAEARDDLAKLNGQLEQKVIEEHRRVEQLKEYTTALAEKQEQMEKELALAREVQQALLPQSYPSFPRGVTEAVSALRFAHRYLPEGRVGGDFFTVVPVSDTQAGVLICDVMGHGVHAALVTAVARVLVEEIQTLAGEPGAFLGELNLRLHHFFEPLPTSMFVTAFYVVIDTVTGSVRLANAGHPHPLHISRAGHIVRTMGDNQQQPPFALGVSKDSVYPTEEDSVKAGDLLLLYTDGLCDLGEGKDLTPDDPKFLSLVQNCARQRGEAFLDALLTQARQFSGQDHFLDDVCLVSIEIDRLEVLS